jgi:hypothetical protein
MVTVGKLLCFLGLIQIGLILLALLDTGVAPGRLKPHAQCAPLLSNGSLQPPQAPPPEARIYPGISPVLAIATAYDALYAPLAEVSVRNKVAYASRHGYWLYVLGPSALACDRPASWSKILAVRAAFRAEPRHAWVAWLDSDAVFVNMDATLDDSAHPQIARAMRNPSTQLIISRDAASGERVNNGVFLLRRSAWSRVFLAAAWNATQFLRDTPGLRNSRFGDQRAFEWVLEDMQARGHARGKGEEAEAPAPVACVPQRELNAYPTTYQEGDLVVHIAGCLAGARRSIASCAADLNRWALRGLEGRKSRSPFP